MDGLWPAALFWAVAAGWVWFTVSRMLADRRIPMLPPLAEGDRASPPPGVTVVLAARDEEERIGQTVGRLLAQTAVELDVVVVDDRSTDRTGEILHALAQTDARLRVYSVTELPDGWLGKPHALHVGTQEVRGEWLLFTDGDAWMPADLVARAIAAARRENVEHLCLFPRESDPTRPARTLLVMLATTFGEVSARVNRGSRLFSVGVGAFNLMRTEAYRAVGGHTQLHYEVVDDVKLGLLLLRAGYRTRILDANREFEVRWAPSVRGFFRGTEKNLFALLEFSTPLALFGAGAVAAAWAIAVVAPWTGSPAGIAAGVALASTVLAFRLGARRMRMHPIHALLAPAMLPLVPAAMLWSTWRTLRRGGIVWRGTFYPLAELRRRRISLFRR